MKRLIIFDWDGTLADSEEYIIANMTAASDAFGISRPSAERIANTIGLKMIDAISVLFPQLTSVEKLAFLEEFKNICNRRPGEEPPLFSTVIETLRALSSNNVLAVASNKSERGISISMQTHALARQYISLFVGTGQLAPKPSPEMIEFIVNKTGLQKSDTFFIGDTVMDHDAAISAGVNFIGIGWTPSKRDKLKKNTNGPVVRNLSELLDLLNST